MSIPEDQQQNYALFHDCLATALHEKISEPRGNVKSRKRKSKKKITTSSPRVQDDDTPKSTPEAQDHNHDDKDDDLADFTDYIATLTFTSLPSVLRSIDHHTYIDTPSLHPALPLTGSDIPTLLPSLDPDIASSLSAYGVTDEARQGVSEFLAPVITAYLQGLATAPPPPRATRDDVDGCEICGRDWINLSYHHLIPRFVHVKAVKRGWHRECDLQNVAWLCGACHRFVHRFASHEDLARKFYTVDLLLAEDEVQRWAQWVGRLRWKGR
ncbi:YisB protein [Poronia punctata]|nr:YisB protein [Poronia punctata]